MNFQFPISKEDGSAYTTEELFDLLAKEPTGHYLPLYSGWKSHSLSH